MNLQDDRIAVIEYLTQMGRSFIGEILNLILKNEAELSVFFVSMTQP